MKQNSSIIAGEHHHTISYRHFTAVEQLRPGISAFRQTGESIMDEREAEGTGADEADLSEEQQRAAHNDVKDRSLQIRLAGVLQLLIGLASAALAALLTVASRITQNSGQDTASSMAFGIAVQVIIALFFIVTGIEAIRLRRWVRPVMLSIMWPALVVGVISCIYMIFMIPALKGIMESSGGTGSVFAFVISCMFVTGGVIFILIPLSLAGLYHGEHVRRYLEYTNPAPCWADAAPLPVFGLSLWFFLISLVSFIMLITSGIPYQLSFGKVITGTFAIAYTLLYALICSIQAYGLYRLKSWAWWLTLAVWLIFSAAGIVNTLCPPAADAFSGVSGVSSGQIDTTVGMMKSIQMPSLILMVLFAVLFIGFMAYIRRFFIVQNAKP